MSLNVGGRPIRSRYKQRCDDLESHSLPYAAAG